MVDLTLLPILFGVFGIAMAMGLVIRMLEPSIRPRLRERRDCAAVQSSLDHDPLRLGGIAAFGAYLIGAIYVTVRFDDAVGLVLIAAGAPVLIAGLSEDFGRLIPAKARFFAALGSALLCIVLLGEWAPRTDIPYFDALMVLAPVAIGMTVLFAGGLCHAVNLIDGMNGLGAVTVSSSAVGIGIVAYASGLPHIGTLAYVLAAATMGFVVMNWPKCRLLLGDAGAYGLGHLLVWLMLLVVINAPDVSVPALVLILFWPVADTLHSILYRALRKKKIFEPDRRHLHQKIRRCLEIALVGRNGRERANPLTTVVMTPLILIPVVTGVLLSENVPLAWMAMIFYAVVFGWLHRVTSRFARTRRRKKPAAAFRQAAPSPATRQEPKITATAGMAQASSARLHQPQVEPRFAGSYSGSGGV